MPSAMTTIARNATSASVGQKHAITRPSPNATASTPRALPHFFRIVTVTLPFSIHSILESGHIGASFVK